MKTPTAFVAACISAAVALSIAPAYSQVSSNNDLVATLSAERVTPGVAGREQRTTADSARPGDVIEYRATYVNRGKGTLRQIQATLPIPADTEYVASSAAPTQPLASLDGKTFAPMPLKRIVQLPNGVKREENVPNSQIRFLRWPLGEMAPGLSTVVSTRVRLVPVDSNSPLASATVGTQPSVQAQVAFPASPIRISAR
jgi:uncharacterized repeat protein (TIGR01451 family)